MTKMLEGMAALLSLPAQRTQSIPIRIPIPTAIPAQFSLNYMGDFPRASLTFFTTRNDQSVRGNRREMGKPCKWVKKWPKKDKETAGKRLTQTSQTRWGNHFTYF